MTSLGHGLPVACLHPAPITHTRLRHPPLSKTRGGWVTSGWTRKSPMGDRWVTNPAKPLAQKNFSGHPLGDWRVTMGSVSVVTHEMGWVTDLTQPIGNTRLFWSPTKPAIRRVGDRSPLLTFSNRISAVLSTDAAGLPGCAHAQAFDLIDELEGPGDLPDRLGWRKALSAGFTHETTFKRRAGPCSTRHTPALVGPPGSSGAGSPCAGSSCPRLSPARSLPPVAGHSRWLPIAASRQGASAPFFNSSP